MAAVKTWKCDVCGYVHEGEEPPETCPVCGVGPEDFSLLEVVAESAGEGAAGRILILGGGIAGLTAAEYARRASTEATITLVSKEPDPPYYRLNLTRLLAGEITEEGLPLHPPEWYEAQRIELVYGEAVELNREKATVRLSDGAELPYDRLILAMGAHPFVPPFPGTGLQGVLVQRTLEDTRALLAAIKTAQRAVVIGGGLLGIEVAGALNRHGLGVTVLEGYGWLLPRQLARPAGELLGKFIGSMGVEVRCGVTVKEIRGDRQVRGVLLADGEELPADLVVINTGIRPSCHPAQQAGLAMNKGVLVDDRLATSDAAIFAAGDLAEHQGTLYGIWPTAYAQGVVAGTNAAGGTAEFRPMSPSRRLKILDIDVVSIGTFDPPDETYQIVEQSGENTYIRLVCRDGVIVGANLIGTTNLSGRLGEAIEQGIPLVELTDLRTQIPALDREQSR
jgi:nitrite reductase (NADH) large subunit